MRTQPAREQGVISHAAGSWQKFMNARAVLGMFACTSAIQPNLRITVRKNIGSYQIALTLPLP
jgi:hypothetical protein